MSVCDSSLSKGLDGERENGGKNKLKVQEVWSKLFCVKFRCHDCFNRIFQLCLLVYRLGVGDLDSGSKECRKAMEVTPRGGEETIPRCSERCLEKSCKRERWAPWSTKEGNLGWGLPAENYEDLTSYPNMIFNFDLGQSLSAITF